MALPHPNISPIPNNEPDAVPSLWNTRYQEIDENFADHESRLTARETELNNARGGKTNLAARLTEMDSNIGATSVDMQNATAAALKFALDQAALANYGVRALREQAQQEGVVTIRNRGVVSGWRWAAAKSGAVQSMQENPPFRQELAPCQGRILQSACASVPRQPRCSIKQPCWPSAWAVALNS